MVELHILSCVVDIDSAWLYWHQVGAKYKNITLVAPSSIRSEAGGSVALLAVPSIGSEINQFPICYAFFKDLIRVYICVKVPAETEETVFLWEADGSPP